MPLSFITGNKGKFDQMKIFLSDLIQADIDLLEIQEIDPKKVIEEKLREALKQLPAPILVEDTSVVFDCMNGLPGPFIRWFLKTVGNDGLYAIAKGFGNFGVTVSVILGYAESANKLHYFESSVRGTIVAPRGTNGFGWDPIFQPEGSTKTFAEMTQEELHEIGLRRKAAEQLKKHIEQSTMK